jgi:hypothetical protein
MRDAYIKGLFILGFVGILIIGYVYFISFSTIEGRDESPLNDGNADLEKQMDEVKNLKVIMNDGMPSAKIISEGDFVESAHHVEGKALVIEKTSGKQILRFENFDTINGPKLNIYLSNSLGNGDFVDLGGIKATKGNVNYDIPLGTDLEKYDKVLVWCVPFGVLFSYSELEEV